MGITKDERIAQLQKSIMDPRVPAKMARLDMSELLYLTKRDEDGAWFFLTKGEMCAMRAHFETIAKIETVRKALIIGGGILIIAGIFNKWRKPKEEERSPRMERIFYLLDDDRAEAYTDEEFKVAMAEVSALLMEELDIVSKMLE